MGLQAGDKITYCIIPRMQRYDATVLSIDKESIVLQLGADSPATFASSQYIMIPGSEEIDYYNEVVGREGGVLRLKRMWTGKRGYFRVDDVFPVIYRKVDPNAYRQESRIYSGYGENLPDMEPPDETVSPRLWSMLVDINTKLGLVLERLHLESEGLTKAESIPVNISASGIRFDTAGQYRSGDVVEVKLLLPTNPAVGILAHGSVVRVTPTSATTNELCLHFIDLVDEVRDIIIQYTLKRQRDIVRRYREQESEP